MHLLKGWRMFFFKEWGLVLVTCEGVPLPRPVRVKAGHAETTTRDPA